MTHPFERGAETNIEGMLDQFVAEPSVPSFCYLHLMLFNVAERDYYSQVRANKTLFRSYGAMTDEMSYIQMVEAAKLSPLWTTVGAINTGLGPRSVRG